MEEDNSQDKAWLNIDEDSAQELGDAGATEDSEQESLNSSMEVYDTSQPTIRQPAPSGVRSKKEAASNLPDKSDLPFREAVTTWSLRPVDEPQRLNFTFPTLTPENGLYYSPTSKLLARKSKKRDSDGNVKEMIAELNARTDLVISRESSPSPRGRRFDRALPSPGFWQWDTLGLSPLLCRPSPMSPRRTTNRPPSLPNTKPRDLEEHCEEGKCRDKHKRKGSLLEWRNKELFEEPVRI